MEEKMKKLEVINKYIQPQTNTVLNLIEDTKFPERCNHPYTVPGTAPSVTPDLTTNQNMGVPVVCRYAHGYSQATPSGEADNRVDLQGNVEPLRHKDGGTALPSARYLPLAQDGNKSEGKSVGVPLTPCGNSRDGDRGPPHVGRPPPPWWRRPGSRCRDGTKKHSTNPHHQQG